MKVTRLLINMDVSHIGSFAEIPKSLKDEIKALEDQLTVPKEKLKAITDHFVKELEKGMLSLQSSGDEHLSLTN